MRAPERPWGPQTELPREGRRGLGLLGILVAAAVVFVVLPAIPTSAWGTGASEAAVVTTVAFYALSAYLIGKAVSWLYRHGLLRDLVPGRRGGRRLLPQRLARADDPLGAVRAQARQAGRGAFLGFYTDGKDSEWVGADPQHAVLVLGPPRSGKTSGIIIPALLAHDGPAISTSTKPDVFESTAGGREDLGVLWWFDPAGESDAPAGTDALRWSPVTAARTWDGALLMARAMVAAAPAATNTNDSHWSERAGALLAPLLHAAALGGPAITDVHRWVLRQDINTPALILEDRGGDVANDVLVGIAQTHDKERSSIFSTAANVLSAYSADGARQVASTPNFDADAFVCSGDTIYIVAPAHLQRLTAPLVVGLLEEIRHATYRRAHAAPGAPPVFFALDEAANIAPIGDLPAMVSEGGGQGAHVMACFQDLSQVRARWGSDQAEGFLTLFQTKAILPGIADARTLEAISIALGEYDRPMASHGETTGTTYDAHHWGAAGTSTGQSTTHSLQRQRVLPPGDIAAIPAGRFLMLRGVDWWLVDLTPYYAAHPWPAVLDAINARRELPPPDTSNHQLAERSAAP